MTVTIELKPEVEAQVIEQAAAQGVPVETYLETFIEDRLSDGEKKPFHETATVEEWEAALAEFANSSALAKARGRFVDDSRESIYRERDDAQL
jgi:hypothetical protein